MLINTLLPTVFLLSLLPLSLQIQRVAVQNSAPMVVCNPEETGRTNFDGIEILLFNEISSNFGLDSADWEYECVDSESAIFNKLTSNPSGYIAGLGAIKVSLNQQLKGFTYSRATLHTGLSILVSNQQNEWIFLKVCTIGTAFTIVGLAIVMAILMYFFERKAYPFEDYLWNAFSSMFFVTSVKLRSTPARILMIVYWFIILIFVSAYAANLTAVLTIDQGSQEIDRISDLEQKVVKTTLNFMSALPLYGARPLKIQGNTDSTTILNDLLAGSVDAYAFEDSIVQIYERTDCQFEKKVRLFHAFNYVMVFGKQIRDDVINQVNLGLESALENNPSLARIQNYLSDSLDLHLTCIRDSPIDENKMSFADIVHLGEILGVSIVLAFFLHFIGKTKYYKRIQAYLVKKNVLNYMDESKISQRKVGDDLIIDNLKQVTKSSMENLTSGINERLDQMDEKVTKFYEILLNTQANSEVNAYDLSENGKSFSDDSMEQPIDEHPMRDFRSDIPLEDYTPMQSPNQSLLGAGYEENEDRIYKAR